MIYFMALELIEGKDLRKVRTIKKQFKKKKDSIILCKKSDPVV